MAEDVAFTDNTFKTGTDIPIDIDLSIDGETVSALAQLVIIFYYLRGSDKKVKFSWWAKDLTEQSLIDEAAAENITVHQILFTGEIVNIEIPVVDTDTLEIEACEEVKVLTEISFLDSNGKKVTVLDEDDCDSPVGTMTKSIAEGWL